MRCGLNVSLLASPSGCVKGFCTKLVSYTVQLLMSRVLGTTLTRLGDELHQICTVVPLYSVSVLRTQSYINRSKQFRAGLHDVLFTLSYRWMEVLHSFLTKIQYWVSNGFTIDSQLIQTSQTKSNRDFSHSFILSVYIVIYSRIVELHTPLIHFFYNIFLV